MEFVALAQHHHPWSFHIDLYAFWIPLALALGLPWTSVRLVGAIFKHQHARELPFTTNAHLGLLAGLAWYWSIQFPNIPVTSATESTTIHLIGGAVVAPALFIYFMRAFRVKLRSRLKRFLSLFTFVLVFGLLNEVTELVLNTVAHAGITVTDTGWDLGTNTVGMLVAFTAMELFRRRKNAEITRPTNATR